ncbi:hypothetical protein WR25_26748 [Diploscapter pachys]|uniref:Uncharacterized protein n=1 Tax=Diploscapter pachys TaxID=2018661 RepID=A0A2A2JMI0_9BILA|nr:hypothetical protein WR25_26748 [Diploscapter pachys]
MNKYYVDYRFKEGVKFLKLGYPGEMLTDYERRLYPLSVTVFIYPRAHILYWKPPDKSDFARMEWEGVPRYLYLQDIVDVRIGDEADKSQINEFSHSMNANLMTIVTAESYVNVHFTSFIYNDIGENSTSLETLAKLIFDLSQRVRRAHHGLLYHVWKKFTPLLYASSNDMFNEFHIRQVLNPAKHSQTDEISMEEGIRQITNGVSFSNYLRILS